MDLQKIIDLLKAQMPNATEEELKASAEKLLDEAKREADRRATEATKTAVENYEKKHGLRDGKAVKADSPKTEDEPREEDNDAPAWAKALIESNNTLKAEVETLKRGKQTESRKVAFDGIIDKLPENLRKSYARTPYDELSDEDFEKLKEEVSNEVNGILKEQKTRGASFHPRASSGGGNTDSEASKEDVDEVVKVTPSLGRL